MSEVDRATAIAALLEVQDRSDAGGWAQGLRERRGQRSYREARLEPGDPVTIVGRALPFSDLADPAAADIGLGSDVPLDDPEVAADLAEATGDGPAR